MRKKHAKQEGKRLDFDILVIGGGISGASFILESVQRNPALNIALILKRGLRNSNSFFAQGGISAVAHRNDSIENHIKDTLLAGQGLCDEGAVRQIISKAPAAIKKLQQWGVEFDAEQTLEGGHDFRRVHHSGDRTGAVIMEKLIQKLEGLPNVHIFEEHVSIDLIRKRTSTFKIQRTQICGAYVLNTETDTINTFVASITILATGGAGKTYRYTSNPAVATGDGVAMAYRAGARIANMEFYQFHPTLLFHSKENSFLISEAVRGEGALLRHPRDNTRFMEKYQPQQMELATRDKVARAIFSEIEQSGIPHMNLDITHMSKKEIAEHFPMISERLSAIGLDMSTDMIPVVPGAHYMCGGVLAEVDGSTDLLGLYALGEVSCTGLHGANRLASNSLIEGLVMALECAKVCEKSDYILDKKYEIPLWSSTYIDDSRRGSQIQAHWRGLRGEMMSYAGIIRTRAGLSDLLQLIRLRKYQIDSYYWSHMLSRDFIELMNIILVAELITISALNRRESRGGHFREDYPQTNTNAEMTILRRSVEYPVSLDDEVYQ